MAKTHNAHKEKKKKPQKTKEERRVEKHAKRHVY